MLISYKLGQTGVIVRVKILNSSVTTGAGLTGLTNASAGLRISTIADSEATATSYTAAGSTIDTITTLGTYAAPTATHCRFKEVDATNHPGVYEIQFENARLAVAGAKFLLGSISGATNAAETDFIIPLSAVDPYDGAAFGMSRIDAAVSSRSAPATAQTIDFTTALPGSPTAGTVGEALKFADTRLDAAVSSAGNVVQSGTLQAGGASSATLASGASATDSLYRGSRLRITGGTGAGQTRVITAYVGATKVATVNRPWTTAPDATSTYSVVADDTAAIDANLSAPATLAANGLDTITVESGLNFRQAMALVTAATAGLVQGAGTTQILVSAAGPGNGATIRITATCDAAGDRTAITYNIPA